MTFKAVFDFILALILLPILAPIILMLILISSIDTGEAGLFVQKRVGKNGKIFNIYKIRTMRGKTEPLLPDSNRITHLGEILRKTKLDEIPQIFNILSGQMSFVGPRPDVAGYADKLQGDDRIILTVKPGITGPAQLVFKNEEKILAKQENPLQYNDEILWPEKVRINKEYILNQNFFSDLKIIFRTFF